MRRLGPYDTQQLTRARLELRWQRPARGLTWLLLAVAVTGIAIVAGQRIAGLPTLAGVGLARQEALRGQVERLRTDLALERAARDQLQQEITALNSQLADANRQLEFLAARGVDTAPPSRP